MKLSQLKIGQKITADKVLRHKFTDSVSKQAIDVEVKKLFDPSMPYTIIIEGPMDSGITMYLSKADAAQLAKMLS
jgi:hypothetical protein